MQRLARRLVSVVGISTALVTLAVALAARQAPSVPIDGDDLGGVVTSARGPEAGVWVVAETSDLPTRFMKIVTTDDRGRYVIPDLPSAQYRVFVRGYGLVDSPKVDARPGQALNLTAVPAPDARAAAQYYPASYWFSLLRIPGAGEFPGTGTGRTGNGIPPAITSQAQFVSMLNAGGCMTCHQLGNRATREFPSGLGSFATPAQAWERRVQSGQSGGGMLGSIGRMGRERALAMFGDWTSRIAAGAVPPAPTRPQGLERHVVVTAWDFADPKKYVHDGASTSRGVPTVNANGPFIASPEDSSDNLWALDPVRHVASEIKVPVRDPKLPVTNPDMPMPSAYWGEEPIWAGQSRAHSTMYDPKGRLWSTSFVGAVENPAWCRQGSSHPSARAYPIARGGRDATIYDLKTKSFALLDLCFGTHHLMPGEGKQANWMFFNPLGGDGVVGWVDIDVYDRTKDEQQAQGWTPLIIDANGNGKRDAWTEPGAPVDPAKDRRYGRSFYSIVQSPVDGSVWGSVWAFPGQIVRVDLGANPPETALAEVYDAPFGYPGLKAEGHTPRGLDIDRNGVVWTNLSGSGHLASFDRRKCKGPLNGPTATGAHCPEGWTLYPVPGPQLAGATGPATADGLYLVWVDQWDTFGLGRDVPFITGSNSDSLMALVNGAFVTVRVPYPLGFYTKGMDGRIDDAKAGWKGRGLWSTHGTRTPWHIEGGRGSRPQVVKFQLRPHALAK